MTGAEGTGARTRMPRRLMRWSAGALLVAGACTLAYLGLVRDLRGDDGDLDPGVERAAVERGDLRETIVASGSMEPLVRVPVIAEVSGIIARVHVEEGERVERGQPLFELDRERLEARLNERRAELELRLANARYDLIGRARVERDRVKRDFERTRALNTRHVASDARLEDVEHVLQLAEIDLHDAHAEVAARKAAVEQAREMLRQAERDLANAVVRAPIDGVVIDRPGEIGRAVADVTSNGGTVVAVIADDRRIRLVADVDENDVGRVRVGQPAEIAIDAFPDERFEGYVRKIAAAGTLEGNVSNFEIEIEFAADERLRVGMSSDARVVVREHHGVLLIPNRAIVRGERGVHVRVRESSGDVRDATIHTGVSDGFFTVVSDGLEEGDAILVRVGSQG